MSEGPIISAFYISILSLYYIVLLMRIAKHRAATKIAYGDGSKELADLASQAPSQKEQHEKGKQNLGKKASIEALLNAVKAQSTFVDMSLLPMILLALVELAALTKVTYLHLMYGILTFSRIANVEIGIRFGFVRAVGSAATLTVLLLASTISLSAVWPRILATTPAFAIVYP